MIDDITLLFLIPYQQMQRFIRIHPDDARCPYCRYFECVCFDSEGWDETTTPPMPS
jgi:hypothetical protein